MTNENLKLMLETCDISQGKVVKEIDNLKALLLEDIKFMDCRYANGNASIHPYTFLVILHDDEKAGIILKMTPDKVFNSGDIHCYIFENFRNRHILSRIMGDKFLSELWPDIKSISNNNPSTYFMTKHLAEITGYTTDEVNETYIVEPNDENYRRIINFKDLFGVDKELYFNITKEFHSDGLQYFEFDFTTSETLCILSKYNLDRIITLDSVELYYDNKNNIFKPILLHITAYKHGSSEFSSTFDIDFDKYGFIDVLYKWLNGEGWDR